jgi:hypothetical protein
MCLAVELVAGLPCEACVSEADVCAQELHLGAALNIVSLAMVPAPLRQDSSELSANLHVLLRKVAQQPGLCAATVAACHAHALSMQVKNVTPLPVPWGEHAVTAALVQAKGWAEDCAFWQAQRALGDGEDVDAAVSLLWQASWAVMTKEFAVAQHNLAAVQAVVASHQKTSALLGGRLRSAAA